MAGLVASVGILAPAAPAAASHSPAAPTRTPICSTTELLGSDASANLYRWNPTTGATTVIQTTALTPQMNGLASNTDTAMVYWGQGQVIYYWDALGDVEGILIDLTGQINGNLESAAATYRGGWYYFGTESGSPNTANGIYRIQIDNAAGGASVVAGSLQQLEVNEPEDTLTAVLGTNVDPDYGDMVASTDTSGNTVLHGSTYDGQSTNFHFWRYDVTGPAAGTVNYIATTSVLLQLARLGPTTYGTNAGRVYTVNTATGALAQVATTTPTFIDLGNEYCTATAVPQIDLTKSVTGITDTDGSSTTNAGDVIAYRFVARNAGNVPLTGVTISDPLTGLSVLTCSPAQPATIAVGTSLTCTATKTVTAAEVTAGSIRNTASVSGAYGTATVTDTATVTVPTGEPRPTVTKVADRSTAAPGDTIAYTVTVANPSPFTMTGITVDDPLPGGAGYISQSTAVSGFVTGSTALGRTYDNTTTGTISFAATPCATPLTRTFAVTDAMTVTDVNLGLNLSHNTRGDLSGTLRSPAGTTVNLFGTSSDTRNNYDILLDSASTNPIDDGSSDTVAVPYYDRLVGPSASLNAFNGESATGTWTLSICDGVSATNGTFNRAQLQLAGSATTTVAATKDNVPGGANGDLASGVPTNLVTAADGFRLESGQSMTVTYRLRVTSPYSGSTGSIANMVSVDSPQSPVATANATVDVVFAPVLQLVKTGPASAVTGDTVTYRFDISHGPTSDGSPVSGVTVSDNVAGAATYLSGDTNSNSRLDSGETWRFERTYTVPGSAPSPLVNTGTVRGTDFDGDVITATGQHSMTVDRRPVLRLVKSGPATASTGDTVTYVFDVSHGPTSDGSAVTAVTVNDNVAGAATYASGDTNSNSRLDSGETWRFTRTYTIPVSTSSPLVNTGTARGTDLDGQTVTATGTHSLAVNYRPAIVVVKSGPATAAVGDIVTYTFAVSHAPTSDGSVVATLAVSDNVAGPGTYVSGDTDGDSRLDSGETWTYRATYRVPATAPDSLTNTVTATGVDGDGQPVSDTDSHSTNVAFAPSIEVVKSGPATAAVGTTANYTFLVRHGATSDGSPVGTVVLGDDVLGTPTYVSGDDGDGRLESGETWTYAASTTIAPDSAPTITNTATATGRDGDNDVFTATDRHTTTVQFSPVLSVDKTGPATATVGQTVTYMFVVTHGPGSDGSPISTVGVVDDIAGAATYVSGDTDTDGRLDAPERWTFRATYVVPAAAPDQLVNTATASGRGGGGGSITAQDSHTTDIAFAPVIAVTKTGPATAAVGDTVTYTVDVRHAPSSDGSAVGTVLVSDDIAGPATYRSGDDGDGLLEAGETWRYTATTVIGIAAPNALVNTATARGTDREGDVVTASDRHTTDVSFAPVIEVVKSGPATAAVGASATYTFAVSHAPSSDRSAISGLSVADDLAGAATYVSGDTDGDGLLDAGETWQFRATRTILATDPDPLVNTATASGRDGDGDRVTATDSHATAVDYRPALQVTKDGPSNASVGDLVTYTFAVSHAPSSDGSAISGLAVSDDIAGPATYRSGDDGDGLLETGETWMFDATTVVLPDAPDPLVNTATATGRDRDGDPLSDTDPHSTAIAYAPAIQVSKSGPATAAVGDSVTYTFDVSHAASSDRSAISGLSVSDDLAGAATYVSGDTDSDSRLDGTETWRFRAIRTVLAGDPDPLPNTATATGTDRDGDALTATDGHSLDIAFGPALSVVKSGPASATVGATAVYSFDVSHGLGSDGSAVRSVVVSDDVAGGAAYVSGDDGDDLLELGETWRFRASHLVTATDTDPLVNTGTARGVDRDGDPVSATDDHRTDVQFAPALRIAKSGPTTATVGQTATYTMVVSHAVTSDGSAISGLAVSDNVAGAATYVSGDDGDALLEAGESWTYRATHLVAAVDPDPLVNRATVTGTNRDGGALTASDTHSTALSFSPALRVVKTGPASASVGATVTYTFDVSHGPSSDGSAVSGLAVADDVAGSATYRSGDDGDGLLEAGETWRFTASRAVAPDSADPLVNTATATGRDRDGGVVTATARHQLDVVFAPALQVAKSGPAAAAVGEVVTYSFAVSHAPSSDRSAISGVAVDDDIAGAALYLSGDTDRNARLDAGEIWLFVANYRVTDTDPDPLVNTAKASGDSRDGDSVSAGDRHSLDIVKAGLEVSKSGPGRAAVGDRVTYSFEVGHAATSDGSAIGKVIVSDDVAGTATYVSGDDNADGLLDVSETWLFEATDVIAATDADPLINTVTVTGIDPLGNTVGGTDNHSLDVVFAPELVVDKQGPATAVVGATVTYTFDVAHGRSSDGSPISSVAVTDNVAGAGTYASGDRNRNGLLDAGETWRFTATRVVGASDADPLVNTATATGRDRDDDVLRATDNHSLDIAFAPVLVVDKQGPASVAVGATATYTFDVAHGAGSDRSEVLGVTVVDDIAGAASYLSGDTDSDGRLDATETWRFRTSLTVGATAADPLVNRATASGRDRDGDAVSATDQHSTDIRFAPVLAVVKSGPATAPVGATVTYTFAVSHAPSSDRSAISGLSVSDDVAGAATYVSGDDGDGLLESGETWRYRATYTVRSTDPDPLTNTATATGRDRDGATRTATDSHDLDIAFTPVLELTKTGPATAAVGDVVTYRFTVEHALTSDGSAISGLAVSDDVTGPTTYRSGDTDGDGNLDDGERWVFEADHAVVAADADPLVNVATASGRDRDGDRLTATDRHSLAIDFAPVLQIEKSGPAVAAVGDTVTYRFDVSHAPSSDGSAVGTVTVSDDIAGPATYQSGDDGDGLLEAGETWRFSADHTITVSDDDPLVNTATASGTDRDGATITATDTHSTDVDAAPALEVVKSGPATAAVGDTLVFTFAVTHGSGSDLSAISAVTVTDDVAGAATYTGGDADGDNRLDGTETWVFEASYLVPATAPDLLVNTATARGTDSNGGALVAQDDHTTDVGFTPALRVVKSGPAGADVGDTVTYDFAVSHGPTSDGSDVAMVTVVDDVAGPATYLSGDDGDGFLEAGETWQFAVAYIVPASAPDQLVNTATATGTDTEGDTVSASDQHTTDIVFAPVLVVDKRGPASAAVGDLVAYTFDVSHAVSSDRSAISGLTVADDVAGAATYVSGDDGDGRLEAGETWRFAASHTVAATDPDPLVNVATASGTDGDGDPLSAIDGHSTDIVFAPVLVVDKRGPASAAVGDLVAYTFDVSHAVSSDRSAISGLTVADDVAGAATYVSGDDGDGRLENGETWRFTASHVVTGADADPLVNVATVSGRSRDGAGVSATDRHSTDVVFAPVLVVDKRGPASVAVGDLVAYTFDVSHAVSSDRSAISGLTVADDVAGAATYVSGDDGDGLLENGETWRFAALHTITADDADPLVNVATASGTDRDGVTVSATDQHSTTLRFAPALRVVKSGPATATVGATVSYTFDVSHAPSSDGSAVGTVSVSDDIAGPASYVSGDDGDGLLEAGETWRFRASHTVAATDPDPLINVATASGTDRDGGAVSATDQHSTDIVFAPVLVVDKRGPASATVGDSVTYTFDVAHDGATSDGSPVGSVAVADDIAGPASYVSGDDGDDLLEAGETWRFEATHTVAATDPDPLINVATASGTDRDGGAVSATDQHSTDIVFAPVLVVDKRGPASAVVGDSVTYTFDVAHDGATSDGSPVGSVAVADDIAGPASYVSGDDGDDLLEAGETWRFEATHAVNLADPDPLVNVATASGTSRDGDPLTATDSHSLDLDRRPVITIAKSGPGAAAIGDTVTYGFVVAHAPSSDRSAISGLAVSDDIAGAPTYVSGDLDGDDLLDAGESWTYTVDYTITATDPDPLVNTATATGEDADGDPVTATDTHDLDVVRPGLQVIKSGPASAAVGARVTYTFAVSQTVAGDGSPIANLAVDDDVAGAATYLSGDADNDDLLDRGETWRYEAAATVAANSPDPLRNVVTVTGEDPLGNTLGASDDHELDVDLAPVLEVVKSGPATGLVGETVTYTFAVSHAPSSDRSAISGLIVSDDIAGQAIYRSGDTDSDGQLDGTETWRFDLSYTIAAADPDPLVNTATASGTDRDGDTVAATDTHSLDIQRAELQVVKSGPATAGLGATVTYTFDVTHTPTSDGIAIGSLAVVDDVTGAASYVSGDVDGDGRLDAGETWRYRDTHVVTAADPDPLVNTVTVTGRDLLANRVTATDQHSLDIEHAPVLVVDKQGPARGAPGDTAPYVFVVSHAPASDGSAVATVTVSDDIAGAATYVSGDSDGDLLLDADETWRYQVSRVIQAGDPDPLVNIGTVTGTDSDGDQVSDTDPHSLDVVRSSITIDKSTTTPIALAGGAARFTIVVTNTGDDELSDVTVTDALVADCDATFATLAAGASATYTCDRPALTADLVNRATVEARDVLGDRVTAADTAAVDVVDPSITITKSPDQAVVSGGTATFTIVVANTGDVALTNVAVADARTPDCDATFATLASGAVETYTCEQTGVTSGFTNTATVTADHPAGATVNDSDTAVVTVLVPGIEIQKGPELQQLEVGEDATFQITVRNTGPVALTDVVVTDVLAPDCDATFATLAAGASETYTCALPGVASDLTNTATASADDPIGGSVTDDDTAVVDVIAPGIAIAKTPDVQSVVTGGTATFTIEVTNTGDVALSDVAVTDVLAPDCDATFASLAVGASESYTCTLAGIAAGFTNTAGVTADDPTGTAVTDSDTGDVSVLVPSIRIDKTPDVQSVRYGATVSFTITVTNDGAADLRDVVVSDPSAPDCAASFATLAVGTSETYSCTVAGAMASFTNTAEVVAADAVGGTWTDDDTADVTVGTAVVTIAKTPDLQTVAAGGDASFTIAVTNQAAVALTGITVSDPLAPGCDRTVPTIAAGATETYTCVLVGVIADLTNTATVTAPDPFGGAAHTASDTADVVVVTPGLTVTKTASASRVYAGDPVTFTIEVANTGDVPLTSVVVTDALVPSCAATFPALAVGASETYTCTVASLTTDLTNVVRASALDPLGGTRTAADDAAVDVIDPAIDVSISPSSQTVVVGGTATFTVTVTNTGDSVLTDVVLTLPPGLSCATASIASLGAGASTTISCTMAGIATPAAVTVTGTGTGLLGGTVSDDAAASVGVLTPAIELQKSPDLQRVRVGQTATFSITVTNSGQTSLASVRVTDALAPACGRVLGALAVGASRTYTCTSTAVTADFTNTAAVTGVDPIGGRWSDDDTADVDAIQPALTVTKTPDNQSVVRGANASFTVTVTNTGDVALTGVAVTDPLAPGCSATIGDLAVGASATVTCTVANVTAAFTNTASASGRDPNGVAVSGSDTGAVSVLVPSVNIEKTAVDPTLVEGDDAVFELTVTNTGQTALVDVVVSDPLAPSCDRTIATLAVAGVETWTCTVTGVTASFTNVASVSADDPLGASVNDTDSADVTLSPALGTVRGVAFDDGDADGQREPGDRPLRGVEIELLDSAGRVVATTTTGIDGSYVFAAVAPGTYSVRMDRPAGAVATRANSGADSTDSDLAPATSTSGSFSVVAGATVDYVDGGWYVPGTIEGVVWTDVDGDGVRDPGDDGLAGVTVQLVGADGGVITTAVTDAAGAYRFPGLVPGSYDVVVVVPTGLELTGGDDAFAVDLASGEVADDLSTGLAVVDPDDEPGTLEQTVWFDIDGDGTRDRREPPLAGVDVVLTWAGPDGTFGTDDDRNWTVTTDGSGHWVAGDLPAGEYRVDVVEATVPAGMAVTVDGGGPLNGTATVNLPAGATVGGDGAIDVGYTGTGTIGDVIWQDADGDGVLDDDEDTAPGVVVVITWAGPDGELGSADDVTFTATTDADGTYAIDGLPAGEYQVSVDAATVPDGWVAPGPETLDLEPGETDLTGDVALVSAAPAPTPTPTPTPGGGPTPTPTPGGGPNPTPTPTPGGGGGGGTTQPPGTLPFTGAETLRLAVVALELIAIGGALVLLTRRRSPT